MPKKTRTNSRAKANNAATSKESNEDKRGSSPSRAQRKREEKVVSRAERAVKKVEARRLAEEEEMVLVKARKQKLTEAERLRLQEEALAAQHREEEKRKKEARRWVHEREYEGVVCVANTNRRAFSDVDARNVEEAIAQLFSPPEGGGGGGRRSVANTARAGFKAFEEKQLERLKREKPGLTLARYRDAVKKVWKKSPNNPLNQLQQQVVNAKKKNQTKVAGFQIRHHKAITPCEDTYSYTCDFIFVNF